VLVVDALLEVWIPARRELALNIGGNIPSAVLLSRVCDGRSRDLSAFGRLIVRVIPVFGPCLARDRIGRDGHVKTLGIVQAAEERAAASNWLFILDH
jgi:hypothetical protein